MLDDTGVVEIVVPGEPTGWARAGGHGKVRFTPKKQRTHKGVLMVYFEQAMAGRAPLEGPLRLDVLFVFSCPKSHHKKRTPLPRRWHDRHTKDRDNLLKQIQDAGNGILYVDDGQCCTGMTTKIIAAQGEAPHTIVTLTPLGDLA